MTQPSAKTGSVALETSHGIQSGLPLDQGHCDVAKYRYLIPHTYLHSCEL